MPDTATPDGSDGPTSDVAELKAEVESLRHALRAAVDAAEAAEVRAANALGELQLARYEVDVARQRERVFAVAVPFVDVLLATRVYPLVKLAARARSFLRRAADYLRRET